MEERNEKKKTSAGNGMHPLLSGAFGRRDCAEGKNKLNVEFGRERGKIACGT